MRRSIGIATAVVLSSFAAAQHWNDNFDSYAAGSQLHGVGGWTGWDNSAGAGALVSNAQSASPSNSVDISGGADLVQQFTGADSGAWVFSGKVFIPTAFTGVSYFIMLNTYNHSGPYDWSVQTHFDAATNLVVDDYTGNSVAFVRDQWMDFEVAIDLDADTREMSVNGTSLGSTPWKTGTGSAAAIAAIDLFANSASSIYYDDLALVPEPATMAALGLGMLSVLRRRRK